MSTTTIAGCGCCPGCLCGSSAIAVHAGSVSFTYNGHAYVFSWSAFNVGGMENTGNLRACAGSSTSHSITVTVDGGAPLVEFFVAGVVLGRLPGDIANNPCPASDLVLTFIFAPVVDVTGLYFCGTFTGDCCATQSVTFSGLIKTGTLADVAVGGGGALAVDFTCSGSGGP